jgi:hypothetical protein
VDQFLRNGQSLLETAEAAARSAQPAADTAILIGRDGSIRAVSSSDWPLESLAAEHGARMAYRVSHGRGRARVEGRSGCRSFLLETDTPVACARYLLGGFTAPRAGAGMPPA